MKKIAIIGAGPGGLAAGLMLVKAGYDVTIFEKDERVGGRSKGITLGDYHFDMGPTFLMYIDVLRDVFRRGGFDLDHELDLVRLDPLYHLIYPKHTLKIRQNPQDNVFVFDQVEPGLGQQYLTWINDQQKKFQAIKPILEKPFPHVFHLFRKDVIKASPYVHPLQSVYRMLSKYSKQPSFIHSLSFQAKYLGMASYQAPSIFTILPYLEHALGLYHVMGGLHRINEKMAELFIKQGGTLKLNTKVKEIKIEHRVIQGIITEQGETYDTDLCIMNADFAYGMTSLVDPKHLKKYTPKKIEKKKYSVSTWMLYLGVNQKLDLPHHEIIFSNAYEQYLQTLMKGKRTKDLSIYVHHPSQLDPTLAPEGKSSLYILAPVPNTKDINNWDDDRQEMRHLILNMIKSHHGLDLEPLIEEELIYTPHEWEVNENVYRGAVFNLAHGLDQMLFLRPHNQFEEFKNLYLVGGGTHPGSGLPTIYQSALIAVDMIEQRFKGIR